MIQWLQETIDDADENEVFKTDIDGAQTHEAFVYESRILHLLRVMKKSEETGLLRWEEV